MSGAYIHRPVLLDECIDALNIRPDGVYIDGTLGRGGHSEQIARRLTGGGRLICIDRDAQALEEGGARLAPWADRITFLHGNFGDLEKLLSDAGIPGADGMLFDLGVSSPQLDDPERGFSYMNDAPLDMRMDREDSLTAWTVVNQWPKEEIRRILYQYGEERYAPAIAGAIERARESKPIETTLELVDVIRSAMPAAAKGCDCPPSFPVCVCGKTPLVKLTPKKPILPSRQELEENPRARSAKLRVAEKIGK